MLLKYIYSFLSRKINRQKKDAQLNILEKNQRQKNKFSEYFF
jgi:hypothetical protein